MIMDSLRYWLTEMHVDGFRFDLAPDPGPRERRLRPARRVLRPGGPGPGGVAGQADRRAVGRRAGRQLRHRPLPARCGASGTAGTGTPMRDFWRRRDGLLGELATRFSGSSDLYGGSRPTADRVGQPDHRPRRLHAAPTWSPTTPSTTRPTARATGTATTTTAPGTAASRARPTIPTCSPCGRRQSRALLTHAAAVVRRAAAARRRRARPHPAGQQQRLLPGQRDRPGSTGRHVDDDLLDFTRRLIALRRAHPVFRRRRFLSGADASALRWFTPGRHGA